ncbi:MAG: alanine/glycine:cation symporter family protein [Salibacteraceae bacterium]
MTLKRLFLPFLFFLFLFTTPSFISAQNGESKDKIEQSEITQVEKVAEVSSEEQIDAFFRTYLVTPLSSVLFWDPFKALNLYDPIIRDDSGNPVLDSSGAPLEKKIPLVVIWLVFGALFFTIRMKFINFRGVKHAIELVQGKFSDPNDKGEVSHFQALATALSATVGLGNIAGVAVAISLGGAGATFWMITAGLLGMASKFVECTLGVKYRIIDADGNVSGGPMYYLSSALSKENYGPLGKILAVIFAVLCIGGSFGGGNMFQANQAFAQMSSEFTSLQGHGIMFGVVLALMVGVVIIGGIRSIAKVTDKIVPFMCGLYVLFSLIIIFINISSVGDAFMSIFQGAFSADALKGGFVGVLIVGFQRAAFSNEAGVGSASIAHSASKTNEPVSEGTVALLEPFIDTVVVCTMTALVLIFTGYASDTQGLEGANLTSAAFESVFPWFRYVLIIAIFLFAFSTMISWSYYGQKAFTYLFGRTNTVRMVYKVIFLFFIVVGSSSSLGAVLDFSDMMILGMAFPNILGLLLLSKEVKIDMIDYYNRVKSGAIKRHK